MASFLRARASLSGLGLAGCLVAASLSFAVPAAAQKGDPPAPPPEAPATPPPPPTPPPSVPPPAAKQIRSPVPRGRQVRRPAWVPRNKRGRDLPVVSGLPIASFPGFARLDDGKSRIFIEVNSKVDISERRDPARLVYKLRGTAVTQATNALPLITDYFSTPVERVQLVQEGNDVNVVIQLREATEQTFQVVETPRGIVLWIDFPRSMNFGKDDPNAVEVDRPSTMAKRLTTTQRLGAPASRSSEDLPPAPVQGN